MNKLKVELQYCYGIKKLNHEFDFKCKTFVIYAPNGVMKTSFAKTFKDLAKGEKTKDLIYPERTTVREIKNESNVEISKEEVFVIEPYKEDYFSDKESTLVVEKELKEQYEKIYRDLDEEKSSFIKNLKLVSQSTDCEEEIISTFLESNKDALFDILERIFPSVDDFHTKYSFRYNVIFDKKGNVKKFLDKYSKTLDEYIKQYDSLVSKSIFFKKSLNTFGTYQANELLKSIEDNSFFEAGHSINLSNNLKISSAEDLKELLDSEMKKIINDEKLKEIFETIDKAIGQNAELRAFKEVIGGDNSLIVNLKDYELFRKKVWLGYLSQMKNNMQTLLDFYTAKKEELSEIIKLAGDTATEWESAAKEFNNRFIGLPFKIEIKNKEDVILKTNAPVSEFIFDDSEKRNVNREELLGVLSRGERRALYILNIIFEIKARKKANQKTLLIVDDIADSFDYKNKYAIVEYLKEISGDDNFYSIILTHNFDFFRTIQSRILQDNKWEYSFVAERLKNEIKLVKAGTKNVTDPFTIWRAGVNNNEKHLIACIPFVRNLIEFKDGQNNDYKTLTHILHRKLQDGDIKATGDVTIADLQIPFSNILSNISFTFTDTSRKIVSVIEEQITAIKGAENSDSIVLEDKIILAIGIRLKAEEYMWSKVSKQEKISGSQTGKLFQRYKEEFGQNKTHDDIIRILESVNIMTPENIHLNSFMYEPILDMNIDELKSLHDKVCSLVDD
ncbi:MAG: hypothetical protein WCX74_02995 [Candidatus Paceibacterota bacterium]